MPSMIRILLTGTGIVPTIRITKFYLSFYVQEDRERGRGSCLYHYKGSIDEPCGAGENGHFAVSVPQRRGVHADSRRSSAAIQSVTYFLYTDFVGVYIFLSLLCTIFIVPLSVVAFHPVTKVHVCFWDKLVNHKKNMILSLGIADLGSWGNVLRFMDPGLWLDC